MILNSITEAIGNTPLLKLKSEKWEIEHVDMYVKLEYLNPFGSVKDRTALGLISDVDFERLRGSEGNLLESSSGNSAVALQMLAQLNGTGLTSVSNRIRVRETEQLLHYIGVNTVVLPGVSECPDPHQDGNQLNVIYSMANEQSDKYIHTSQYENYHNSRMHYETTAYEIFSEIIPDAVVLGAGTGGTGAGIKRYIDEHDLAIELIGIVADPNDYIPGIRTRLELHETKLFHIDDYHRLTEVISLDGLKALQELVQKEGVMAGPTTGANFKVALDWARENDGLNDDGSRKSVVFIACDRLQGYMSYIADRQPELFGIRRLTDALSTPLNAGKDTELEPDAALVGKTIIDVRSVASYKAFHIPGSISYPEDMLREVLLHDTPFDDDVTFVCPVGEKSLHFANVLRARGVAAHSIKGGLGEWRRAKLPLKRQMP